MRDYLLLQAMTSHWHLPELDIYLLPKKKMEEKKIKKNKKVKGDRWIRLLTSNVATSPVGVGSDCKE